jgi:hypothetical protein
MADRRTVVLLAVVVALAALPAATAGDRPTAPNDAVGAPSAPSDVSVTSPITGCTTITEPGEYVLADDVRNGSPTDPETGLGACIAVRASDVTLRGGNHTVAAGPDGQPGVVGVLVGGAGGDRRLSNVTVRNLTTTRWGAGVAVFGATGATLRNVSAVNNLGDGIFAERAPGVALVGGTVRGSNTGVFLRNAPGARVADLNVSANLAGVSVRRSNDATVSGVEALGNSRFGVAAFASDDVTVADATVSADGFAGVALAQADDAVLRNLTVTPGSAAGPGGADPTGVYLNGSTARLVGVTVADAPGLALYATGDSTAVGERVRLGTSGGPSDSSLSFESRDVALDPATETPPLPTDRRAVGDPLFAVPTGERARLSVSVGYDDATLERAGTAEEALAVWRFDAGVGWERIETSVDAEQNVASVAVGNLTGDGTVLALVGEGSTEAENGTATE